MALSPGLSIALKRSTPKLAEARTARSRRRACPRAPSRPSRADSTSRARSSASSASERSCAADDHRHEQAALGGDREPDVDPVAAAQLRAPPLVLDVGRAEVGVAHDGLRERLDEQVVDADPGGAVGGQPALLGEQPRRRRPRGGARTAGSRWLSVIRRATVRRVALSGSSRSAPAPRAPCAGWAPGPRRLAGRALDVTEGDAAARPGAGQLLERDPQVHRRAPGDRGGPDAVGAAALGGGRGRGHASPAAGRARPARARARRLARARLAGSGRGVVRLAEPNERGADRDRVAHLDLDADDDSGEGRDHLAQRLVRLDLEQRARPRRRGRPPRRQGRRRCPRRPPDPSVAGLRPWPHPIAPLLLLPADVRSDNRQ